MKHLFGPVNSRRLGLSQGIDLVPAKICNFNCIYCEIGRTSRLTCERQEYIPTADILDEIDALFAQDGADPTADAFTITGSGEPTLHRGIGSVIRYLKTLTDKPVAVLTNGSLLHLREVQHDLMEADIVIPSLDAARPASFRKVNRPASDIDLGVLIKGLAAFRKGFMGHLWLEILLVRGINDSRQDIITLKKAVEEIEPERIQLNTVTRPPLESFASPVQEERMAEAAALLDDGFPGRVETLVQFSGGIKEKFKPAVKEEIIQMLKRRPCTIHDVCEALNLERGSVNDILTHLKQTGEVRVVIHNGKAYYQGQPNHIDPPN